MESRTSLWGPSKKGPGFRWLILVMGMALVLAACGGTAVEEESAVEEATPLVEGRPPTVSGLAGIWLRVEDPEWRLVRFSVARKFAIDDRGLLETTPAALGSFELKGHTITFTSEGSDVCTEGDSWAWQAALPEAGRLHIVHTEEAAGQCRIPLGTEWRFVRVSPTSAAGLAANTELAAADTAEGRPPTASELPGVWLGVADGLQARFNSDGTFAIDSAGQLETDPAVPGTYKLDGDTITFREEGGHACPPGDSFAWRVGVGPNWVMHIVHTEEAAGKCRVPLGTKWTFVRLSPS